MLNDILATVHTIPGIEFALCKYPWRHGDAERWLCTIEWSNERGDKHSWKRKGASAEEAADRAFTAFRDVSQYGIPQREITPQLLEHQASPDDELPF